MPEGDTIHRSAATLRPALEGQTIDSFWARKLAGTRPRAGERIEVVRAQGKHLLIEFSGGLTLQTHMKMAGSWHLYRRGQRWRQPRYLSRVVLEVPQWEAVCFSAPDIRTFVTGTSDPTPVSSLGPDLCDRDGDVDSTVDLAVKRLGALVADEVEVAVALLDQRVAAGIGNVFKSEVCHACGINPFTPLSLVDNDERRRLYRTASRQLRSNLVGGPRITVPGGLGVYGRNRRPCRVCGAPVRLARQGPDQRVTYWCAVCQPPVDSGD